MSTPLKPSGRRGNRICNVPNLDAARERLLLARARSGNSDRDRRDALNELWISHGKFVAAIAARHRCPAVEHADLVHAGYLGLHAAIMGFDLARRDIRLSAYAAISIRRYIHDYIRRHAAPVRLPDSRQYRQLAQCGGRLLADARKACDRESVEPSDSELHERVGRRIGLTSRDVAAALRVIQNTRGNFTSPDHPVAEFRDETAPTDDDLIWRMDRSRLRDRIRKLANEILGERERIVFLDRSIANHDQVPSLESLAQRFKVSIARVHQIELSAARKVAAALTASGYAHLAQEGVVVILSHARARRRRDAATVSPALKAQQTAQAHFVREAAND